jgi:hypothetical protein
MKKRSILAALAGTAVFAILATATSADAMRTDACIDNGLYSVKQASKGWSCETTTRQFDVSRLQGLNDTMCKDGVARQTVLQAINPAGNPAEEKSLPLTEERLNWGGGAPYPATDGACAHPLV